MVTESAANNAKPKILIVEDEMIVAREMEARITAMGYEVVGIASWGAEAMELASRTRPDLALMDVVLKGCMNGIAVAGEIRKRFGIPTVYVTAYGDEDTLERANMTKPYGYILKPFSEEELHDSIKAALEADRKNEGARKVSGGAHAASGD